VYTLLPFVDGNLEERRKMFDVDTSDEGGEGSRSSHVEENGTKGGKAACDDRDHVDVQPWTSRYSPIK
jgi:hypothetical protein